MDQKNIKELFHGAFGYRPAGAPVPVAPIAPPPPTAEPEKRTYVTRDSVVRENPLETSAAVQSLVWGNGSPGPGQQVNTLGPPPQGMAAGMDKSKGWGQTSG